MKIRRDFVDVTGQRFGKLIALSFARGPSGQAGFMCRCDCGVEKFVSGGNLRRRTRSCGCDHKAAQLRTCYRHGRSKSAEYGVFCTLKQRCCNPSSEKWPAYGGAGIECRFRDFEHFYACVGSRPSRRHSIDRIDTFGHYEPGNVRWATPSDQQRNRRRRVAVFSLRDYPLAIASALSFGG